MHRRYNNHQQIFYQRGLILGLLISVALVHTRIPALVTYFLAITIYIPIILLYVRNHNDFVVPQYYLHLYLLIAAIASIQILISPSIGSTARLGAFLVFTATNFFVIPRIFTFERFVSVLSRFSAMIVIIGFFPYLGVSPSFAGIDLSLWHGHIYWKQSLNPITSIFYNPNALGFLTVIGSLASLSEIRRTKSTFAVALFGISITGLLWTNYRTGMIALFVCSLLYTIYTLYGSEIYALSIVMMIVSIIIGLSWMFGFMWGPEFLTEISLNNRRALWTAGYQALTDAPFIGHGLGQSRRATEPYLDNVMDFGLHNAYLRMFVETGVIGGFAYLLFTVSAVVGSVRVHTQQFLVISLLLVSITIIQLFNGLGLIGISMHSVIMSIVVGFYMCGITDTEIS